MPVGTLPQKAQDIYEAALEAAKEDGHDDETAAKIAWGAVKRAGYVKGDDGEWHKMHFVEMHITKASLGGDGVMRWAATVSKFDTDAQGDEVTPDFYKSAIAQIEAGKRPSPVLCVSHIDHGKPADAWVPGDALELYIDGEQPKAKGIFRDTPLGRAAFESIRADWGKPDDGKIRISLGFYDEGSEPIETKMDGKTLAGRRFLRGWIKHLALTRVPVIPETSIEAMEVKSMPKTKREDAASIVGEELADELVSLDEKAGLDEEIMVTKDETEEKAATKTEGGKEYGPSAYLVVPDKEKPDTWKLPIEEEPGKVTVEQLGRAAAALGPGFRGKKVQLSDDERKAAAKALIGKYHSLDVEDGDIPPYLWSMAGTKKPQREEKSVSLDRFRDRIYYAWRAQFPERVPSEAKAESWVREVMDDAVIVGENDKIYRAPYMVDAETGNIQFGTPVQVQEIRQFVPASDMPPSTAVPRVATKAYTDERENQAMSLLKALAEILGVVWPDDINVDNSAALGNRGANPPRAEELGTTKSDTPQVRGVLEFVDSFAANVKAALLSDGDRTEKFTALQGHLNAFGEGVQALVKDATPPSSRDTAEIVADAVQKAVEPLHNQLASVKAELEELRAKAATGEAASPRPRSLDTQARVVQQPTIGAPMLKKKAYTAKELAWQTTRERGY